MGGQKSKQPQQYDLGPVLDQAGSAVAAGIAPDSVEGKAILDRIVAPDEAADDRIRYADQIDAFTDRRVERYWQLTGVINGRPPFPAIVPTFEWLAAALRVHL